MAAKLKKAFPEVKVDLIKGRGGVYNITVDGREVWNKREMNDEYPDDDALIRALGAQS